MFWVIIILCVGLDQLTKYWIASTMSVGETAPFSGNLMQFHYILNDGASLSILSGRRWLFIGLTIVVLIVVIVLHYKVPRNLKGFHIALAFFIGGTLGNFVDRVRTGYVIDFLDPNLWSIFNVADCFITISVIVICCMLLFGRLGKLLDKGSESKTNED